MPRGTKGGMERGGHVHGHSEGEGQATNDLLVLRVVSIAKHLLDRLLRARADHDQAHAQGGRLAGNGGIVEEDLPRGGEGRVVRRA